MDKKMEIGMKVAEAMNDLREKIFAGTLTTITEINNETLNLFQKLNMTGEALYWMRMQLYEAYVLNCEVEGKVPVSGYYGRIAEDA